MYVCIVQKGASPDPPLCVRVPGGGGGGHLIPLEAVPVPDAREKKNMGKGYPNQGWARYAKRVSISRKIWEKGRPIQIAIPF